MRFWVPIRVSSRSVRRGNVAGDFEVEAGHARHPPRTGQQFHLADPEIAQDLRTDAVDARVPTRRPDVCGDWLTEHGQKVLAAFGTMQQHDHAAPLPAPIAAWATSSENVWPLATRVKEVDHRERFMHTHQRLLIRANLAFGEHQMHFVRAAIGIRVQGELAVRRLYRFRQRALDQRLVPTAVMDQIGDGADLEAMCSAANSTRSAGAPCCRLP
jgi:hypothetical protein